MFLEQKGHSQRFTFDIIYSALQKSLRRGNMALAIEMGYEFIDFPNALKKRLIQNCTEDCPDLILINDIFNTPADLQKLMPFIPVICKHVKNHDGCYGMRVACEKGPIFSPPKLGSSPDDLLTLLCKLYGHICQNDELTFISYFQKRHPTINLSKIYNFLDKNITFLYSLCVWETVKYMHEKYQLEPFNFIEHKKFDMTLKLPNYVYDKHVKISPIENKRIEFFLNNLILYPRKEESDLEIEGRKLYLETNKGVGEIIKQKKEETTIKKEKSQKKIYQMFGFINDTKKTDNATSKKDQISIEIPDKINEEKLYLIQTQLKTKMFNPPVYFCSLNKGKTFDFILKGPYLNPQESDSQILSNKIKQKLLPNPEKYSYKKITYKNQIFLLYLNIIPIDKDDTVTKSSRIEENVTIYNGCKYAYNHAVTESLSSSEEIELLKVLAYRKLIGSDDTCIRNILYYDKHFYSIDDAVTLRNMPYMFVTHLVKYRNNYEKMVWKNFLVITEFLNKWNDIIGDDEDIPDNVKAFMLSMLSSLLIQKNWIF